MSNQNEQLDKERRILEVLRKVISAIVRDTTPNPGIRHPLKPATLEDIRQCFILISTREKEISAIMGDQPSKLRPQYADKMTPDDAPKVIHLKNIDDSGKH